MLKRVNSRNRENAPWWIKIAVGGIWAAAYALPPVRAADEPHGLHLRRVFEQKVPAPILSLDIAKGSDLIAVALATGKVQILKFGTSKIVHEISFPETETDERQKEEDEVEPIRVRFSPDGGTLAICFLSRIYQYEPGTWQETRSLGVGGEDTMHPRPAPELERRPTSDHPPQQRPELTQARTYEVWRQQRIRGDGRTRITDFAFTPDGTGILAAYCRGSCYDSRTSRRGAEPSGNDPLRLWDVRSGQLVWEHMQTREGAIERVVISPDGSRFAACSIQKLNRVVEVHDLRTGRLQFSSRPTYYTDPAPPIHFTPDGKKLITFCVSGCFERRNLSSWQQLAIYDASDGNMMGQFSDHDGAHWSDLSPDGRLLAATTWYGGKIMLWDVARGQVIDRKVAKFGSWLRAFINRVRFDPNGHRLVVANDQRGVMAVYELQSAAAR
jgi:WD40 repeat protein